MSTFTAYLDDQDLIRIQNSSFLKQMDLTIVFWLCQLQKKQDDKELLVG